MSQKYPKSGVPVVPLTRRVMPSTLVNSLPGNVLVGDATRAGKIAVGALSIPDLYAKGKRVRGKWSEWEWSIWYDLTEDMESRRLCDVLETTGKTATFPVAKSFRMMDELPDDYGYSAQNDWSTAHNRSRSNEGSGLDGDFMPHIEWHVSNDGAGSGLDADLLDGANGENSDYFCASSKISKVA